MSFGVAGTRDCTPCQKWAKRQVFLACPKTKAAVGHLKRLWKEAFSMAGRSTRDMFIRDVRRSGRRFPESDCILELQIFNFGKVILCDRCNTLYDLASLFRGRRSTLNRWSGKIAKRIGTRPSALHSTFHFWKEASQNFFVFDVVNLENWGGLAELLRFRRCQVQKLRKVCRIALFSGNVLRATTACTFSASQLPKMLRAWCVLYILTWKCASRHNGVHLFDVSTSKKALSMLCFVHFDLDMCFAPQRRPPFRHLNFQKFSENGAFCTFWLGNVLRATTACNFSSLIWPHGSAPAALASLLFDPGATNHWKNTVFCAFAFAHLHFFLIALSLP